MNAAVPLVSVVIASYNAPDQLSAAIESVLAQTYRPLEVVVVDDGSEAGKRRAVRRVASASDLVALVEHDTNLGIAAARNTGVRHSSGSLVAFLDQDDLWRPDKLELQVGVLRTDTAEGIGLVFTDIDAIDQVHGGKQFRFSSGPPGVNDMSGDELLMALFDRNFVTISSALVRRRCFEEVGFLAEDIRSGADDYEFFVRVAERFRFVHVAQPLTIRRVHGANFSDGEKFYPDDVRIIESMRRDHPDLPFRYAERKARLFYMLGRALDEKGDRRGARAQYRASLRSDPKAVRSWAALALSGLGPVGDRVIDGYRWARRTVRSRR